MHHNITYLLLIDRASSVQDIIPNVKNLLELKVLVRVCMYQPVELEEDLLEPLQ